MKIRDIDTLLIDSPGRKWTIVRVFTDEGLVGLGEATYSNKEPVVAAAVEHMKGELIGQDAARIEYLWHQIYRLSSVSGIWRMAGPVWMSALAGIDIALWDLKGKVAGLPLVDLLGGRCRDRVDMYTHFGGATPADSAQMCRRLVEQGYTALKSGARSRDSYRFDPYVDDGVPQETAAHLMASIPNAAPMEFVTGISWRDEILTQPLRVEAGMLLLPDAPGLGIELDMDGVEKHRWRPGDPR
ncbi:MAG: enolase C-terminal domain-like protein [Candidatus Latescibacterota bacterium]